MASHSWNTDNSGSSGYDDDDRLTYWKLANNSINHNWSLSDVGDWDSFTNTGITQTRAHNSVHEISSITESGNTTNLVHDVKGNLTTNANTHTYDYDFDNRMQSVDTDGDSIADISFEYDALGRRVLIDGDVGIYSGQQLIAKYDSGATAANPDIHFVYASYIDEPILLDKKTAANVPHQGALGSGSFITITATANTASAH